jgi:hypothetical protein
MISIEIKGGLGNQLFQIATAIAHSLHTHIPFILPRDKFHDEGPGRPTYWTTLFRHLEPYLSDNIQTVLPNYTIVKQNERKYEPIPTTNENTFLKGYYQHHRYFSDMYDRILEITRIPEIRQQVLSKYTTPNTQAIRISMHFRRGDYCKVRCYHPVLTEYYYTNAMMCLLKHLKYNTTTPIKVVCFYEEEDKKEVLDIVQHVRVITETGGYTNIEYITNAHRDLEDWEQLLVMSGHDHHIIANSTFSWWAAYLNPSTMKHVCFPDTWFGHQLNYIDTTGFEVEGWLKIKAFGPLDKVCDC